MVDETSNIRNAAECIVNGAGINNNIFCICGKEVGVMEEVAENLLKFRDEGMLVNRAVVSGAPRELFKEYI